MAAPLQQFKGESPGSPSPRAQSALWASLKKMENFGCRCFKSWEWRLLVLHAPLGGAGVGYGYGLGAQTEPGHRGLLSARRVANSDSGGGGWGVWRFSFFRGPCVKVPYETAASKSLKIKTNGVSFVGAWLLAFIWHLLNHIFLARSYFRPWASCPPPPPPAFVTRGR
jgi:hypothetical protein